MLPATAPPKFALLGLSAPMQWIRHAMSLLGERELVRWIRMATTLVIGDQKCSGLVCRRWSERISAN